MPYLTFLCAALVFSIGFFPCLSHAELDPAFNTEALPGTTCATQLDGRILVGRWGTALSTGIIRLLPDGSLDTNFSILVNGSVEHILIQDDQKILIIGEFTSVDGVPRGGIARLNIDGSLDLIFAPVLNARILGAALQQNGKILVGGEFTNVNGIPISNIARLNGDGTLDATFSASVAEITAIYIQRDGKILVGGIPPDSFKRLNPNGSLDLDLMYAGNTMALDASGGLALTGEDVVWINSDNTIDYSWRYIEPGATESSYHGDYTGEPQISGISLMANGGHFIFGKSNNGGCFLANGESSISPTFYTDNTGASEPIHSISIQRDGKIIAMHNLKTMRFSNEGYDDSLSITSVNRIQWERNGCTPEVNSTIFELSSDDGVTWTTLGNGAYFSGGTISEPRGWELTGLTLPSTGLVRARAAILGGNKGMSRSIVETVISIGPEISVSCNDALVGDGATTPAEANHTDFGSLIVTSEAGSLVRTFTIGNSGESSLVINSISLSGSGAGDFSIASSSLPQTIPAHSSGTFQVTFDPSAVGLRSATVTIQNNDSDYELYDFGIQGKGIEPEINIQGNSTSIANNDSSPSINDHTDFGSFAGPGIPIERTFTIENLGTSPLRITSITKEGANPQDFSIAQLVMPTTIAVGSSKTFAVTFNPTVAGEQNASIRVNSDDADEGHYQFSVRADSRPEINVKGNGVSIIDGDNSPSLTDWTDFSTLSAAPARIRTYTIENVGTGPLAVTSLALSGTHASVFSIDGITVPRVIAPGASSTFTVALGIGTPGLRSATVTVMSDDADEMTYDFAIQGPGLETWELPVQQYTFASSAGIPVTTANQVNLSGKTLDLQLTFAPAPGTNLTVIRSTGLQPILGTYAVAGEELSQGKEITLTYNGIPYFFVANYYGGRGNDFVLHWAGTRPYAWGNNASGRIGDNSTVHKYVPTEVRRSSDTMFGKTVLSVAAGGQHTLALLSDGTVAAWGQNANGQLGDTTTTDSHTPIKVHTLSPSALNNRKVVAIAAGYNHSLALCSDGTLVAWGLNANGQVGDNTTAVKKIPTLVHTGGPALTISKRVVRIASGPSAFHSMALCSDGTLVAWGRNTSKCLGTRSTAATEIPVLVRTDGSDLLGRQVIDMSAGLNYSIALCSDGTVVTWGDTGSNRLGRTITPSNTADIPKKVVFGTGVLPSGNAVVAIAAGEMHAITLTSAGKVITWGDGASGKLGNASTTDQLSPVSVSSTSALAGKLAVAIGAGNSHSYALCSDGSVHAWGLNSFGQLAMPTNIASKDVPVQISGLPTSLTFSGINSGFDHSMAMVASPQARFMVEDHLGAKVANNTLFDFGTAFAPSGSSTTTQQTPWNTKDFYIKNSGNASLSQSISLTNGIMTDEGFDIISYLPTVLSIGQSGMFNVSFNPWDSFYHTAARTDKVTITANTMWGMESFIINVKGVANDSVVTAHFNSPTMVPVTTTSLTATNKTVNLALGFQPIASTKLKVINFTGTGNITGQFSNLPADQVITLSYNGQNYHFLVNYFGGTGNDLVLEHIGVNPLADDDKDGINNLEEFRYATQVNDAISFMIPLTWTTHVNSSSGSGGNGGLLQVGPGTGWDADAVATAKLTANGTVSFTAAAASKAAVGLTLTNTTRDFSQMTHAIVCGNTTLNRAGVYESGTLKADLGPYLPTTVFSIQRQGNNVNYLKNRVIVYSSLVNSSGTVMIDSSLASSTGGITSACIMSDDRDGDGMLDEWEFVNMGFPPSLVTLKAFDEDGNSDGDALTNIQEFLRDTSGLILAKPSSNIKTGIYANAQVVSLASVEDGVQIRYSLDGSIPTLSSTLYSGPVSILETRTLRAIAFNGSRYSDELKETITIDSITSAIPRGDMKLWLRADSGISMSEANDITFWKDQSGRGNNAWALSPNKPVWVASSLNGRPAVSFRSVNNAYMSVMGAASSNTPFPVSIFTVVRRTSGSGNAVILEKFDPSISEGYSLQSEGLSSRKFIVNGSSSAFSVSEPGTDYLLIEGISDLSRRFYMNGIIKNTLTLGEQAKPVDKPMYIGGRPTTSSLEGEIAEIMVFERALTDQERRNIEHYVYSKYGIGAPLNPPAFNLSAGVYSAPQTLSMSADAGAVIHYTTDGTPPSVTSPIYSAPLLVTQTSTFRAIALKSGFAESLDAAVSLVFDADKYLVPTDGLRLWLRADGGVMTENGLVTRWEDLSGQHNHASQHLAEMQPITALEAVNGRPVVIFDKSRSTHLNVAGSSSLDLQSVHVFAILARTEGNESAIILEKWINNVAGFSLQHSYDNLRWTASGYVWSKSVRGYMPSGRSPLRMSDYHLVSGSFGNPALSLSVDKQRLAYDADPLYIYADMVNESTLNIGGNGMSSGSFDGNIAAILIYNRVLTTAEREGLEAYAKISYGISPLDVDRPSQALITDVSTLCVAEGGTGPFTVRLAARPAGNVAVAVSVTGDPDITQILSGPIIFTPSNWDSPQTLTMAAAQDADGSDGVATVTLSTLGLSSATVSIKEIDDEPGVTVWENKGGTVVTEGLPSVDYYVVLSSAPTASVTITATSASPAIQLSPSILTFNSNNWDVPQTIPVTAVNDAVAHGDIRQAVITHVVVSSDPVYHGMPVANVDVTIYDNDVQKIIVDRLSLMLQENVSPGATLQVKLDKQPEANVMLQASLSPTGDPDIKLLAVGLPVSSVDLIFTPLDWNVNQPLYIAAADDADREDGTSILTLIANSVEAVKVSLSEVENDLAGISLLQTEEQTLVVEGGLQDIYALVLRSKPWNTVTITPTEETGRLRMSPGKLHFTPYNWAIPQYISVGATDDNYINTLGAVLITHTASSVENHLNMPEVGPTPISYNGMPVPSLTVTIVDNDQAENPAEPPTAPWSVNLSEINSSSVKVSWTDISFNETQFVVEAYEVVDGEMATNWQQLAVSPANTLSVTVLGLKEKTQYAFAVSAQNGAGLSRGHEVKLATTPASVPPSSPTPTVLTQAPDYAVIEWQPLVAVKTGFRIEQQVVGEELAGWLALEVVSANTSQYHIEGLDATKSYRFRLITLNSNLESVASSPVTIPAVPGPVQNLALSLSSWNSVKLVWTGPVSAVSTFKLSRFSPSEDTSPSRVSTLSNTTFSFHETALEAAIHKYCLSASNSRGEGPISEAFITTTQGLPPAPGDFTATQSGARKIHLQWQDNAIDELHYSLERKLSSEPGSAYSAIATLPAQLLDSGAMTYYDDGLEALKSYAYRLKCTNVHGSSSWVEASGTTVDHVAENRRPDGTGLLFLHGLAPAVMEVRSVADVASQPDNDQFIVDSAIVGGGRAYEGRKNAALAYDGVSENWTLIQEAVRKRLADDSLKLGLLITDLEVPSNNEAVEQALDYFVALPSDIATIPVELENLQPPPWENTVVYADGLVFYGLREAARATTPSVKCGCVVVFSLDFSSSSGLTYVGALWPPSETDGDGFGSSLSYDEGILVVGTPGKDTPALSDVGCVYMYDLSGAEFPNLSVGPVTISPPAGRVQAGMAYGYSVAVAGSRLVIGAPDENVVTSGTTYLEAGAVYLTSVDSDAKHLRITNLLPSSYPGNSDDSLADEWREGMQYAHFGYSVAMDHAMRILVGAPHVSGEAWESHFEAASVAIRNAATTLSQGGVWLLHWDGQLDESRSQWSAMLAAGYPVANSYENQLQVGSGCEFSADEGIFALTLRNTDYFAVSEFEDSGYLYQTGHLPSAWNGTVYQVTPLTSSATFGFAGLLRGVDADDDLLTYEMASSLSSGIRFLDTAPEPDEEMADLEPGADLQYLTVQSRAGTDLPSIRFTNSLPEDLYAISIKVSDDRGGHRNVPLKIHYGIGNASLDTDGDGIPDAWEMAHGLNPADATDAGQDTDNDGLSSLEEYLRSRSLQAFGVDPALWDLTPDGDEDGDSVPNKSDADPFDPSVGQLMTTLGITVRDAAVIP